MQMQSLCRSSKDAELYQLYLRYWLLFIAWGSSLHRTVKVFLFAVSHSNISLFEGFQSKDFTFVYYHM